MWEFLADPNPIRWRMGILPSFEVVVLDVPSTSLLEGGAAYPNLLRKVEFGMPHSSLWVVVSRPIPYYRLHPLVSSGLNG